MKTSILNVNNKKYSYYNINDYGRANNFDISRLPLSLKVLLENVLRNSDKEYVSPDEAAALAQWEPNEKEKRKDISFHPSRVIMQDLTGGAAIADLAAMRDAVNKAGGKSSKINPKIPVDMIIDHSVMVDFFGSSDSFQKNVELEFERNQERYRFFKWGQQAFSNFKVVPPGTGIIHQVNLEYLATVISTVKNDHDTIVFPDTLVGTDSHTTMINSLGVLGWGVGGIEAEAAMLGQPLTMLIPDVVGFRLVGRLSPGITATDMVLKIVQRLRSYGVVGSFVEFFGSGLNSLSLADRATVSNMAPEYGATCGFFPIDDELLNYLSLTGRGKKQIDLVEAYAKAQGLWRVDSSPADYSHVIELDISTIEAAVAGPRRPQDLIYLKDVSEGFSAALKDIYKVKHRESKSPMPYMDHDLTHGDVVIAAITSCTNTSNPHVLITAGLIARKAVEMGLYSKPWVKTSFAPGSQVVTSYLEAAGLMKDLDKLGFNLCGYGCTTCIGNSGPLPDDVKRAIDSAELVTANILSGNRNFEGRISPESKASYLASPPLVVLYALAGSVRIDLTREPIARDSKGKEVFLKDLWPSEAEIREVAEIFLKPQLFRERYSNVFEGPAEWQKLDNPKGDLFDWEPGSTYIRKPPFFDSFIEEAGSDKTKKITNARCLAIFPDSTTTDHISPAGNIAAHSPAGRYLISQGVEAEDFNSYGSRRANHEVMMRGTFANIRIKNLMNPNIEGGYTTDSKGQTAAIYDGAMSWKGTPLIVFAGKEYGTGSSRDWAAKGPKLQGVKAVIAKSYERIHRSNLLEMGILPLEFQQGASVDSLDIKGDETFSILGLNELHPSGELIIEIIRKNGGHEIFPVKVRIDTDLELKYWKAGGILNYVLLEVMKNETLL
jgi:aconitate hydratase